MASGCKKTSFDGGNYQTSIFKADCRQNIEDYGDLFSWKAVSQYKDVLCPDGWRVPTMQDFINLDIAMGGTGENRIGDYAQFINANYLNSEIWGGALGGACHTGGARSGQGVSGEYWSQSELEIVGIKGGIALYFTKEGGIDPHIFPEHFVDQSHGFMLRCVQNK
jgi:uncharacterized protein (TIGR02145 family)